MHDRRLASLPLARREESWSVATNVAQAAIPASAQAASPSRSTDASATAAAEASHASRRGRNLGRQFVQAGETRCARPHDPARHRDDECQRDKKIEWEQDCSRRQHEDCCPMTGTCAVCTGDERMRRQAEQREADESSPLVRGCSSCEGREEHGGGGRHRQGENCRLDAARARSRLRCSCHCH